MTQDSNTVLVDKYMYMAVSFHKKTEKTKQNRKKKARDVSRRFYKYGDVISLVWVLKGGYSSLLIITFDNVELP